MRAEQHVLFSASSSVSVMKLIECPYLASDRVFSLGQCFSYLRFII